MCIEIFKYFSTKYNINYTICIDNIICPLYYYLLCYGYYFKYFQSLVKNVIKIVQHNGSMLIIIIVEFKKLQLKLIVAFIKKK